MEEADKLYDLGRRHLQEDETAEKGLQYLKEAADLGHTKAQYNYGILLIQKSQAYGEAFHYFQLAAKQGHARSNYMVGCYFAFGFSFPISLEDAAYFFRLAADDGVADAQYDLAVLLLSSDANEAVDYFKLAAEQENADAHYNLGVCYAQGLGIAASQSEALKHLEIAAKLGQPKAEAALAKIHHQK